MRIAWFSHRYHPCIGGAENYGRAMVRRFVAAGHEVDVFTSDAHDLWYFNDRNRRKLEEPPESRVDGARVRRFAVRHIPLQRYVGRLLSYAPHWPTRCPDTVLGSGTRGNSGPAGTASKLSQTWLFC